MDLVKKKTVNFDLETYERLSKLAAQLRMDNPGGGFVSMSAAVAVLLDGWKELQSISKGDIVIITSERMVDRGEVVTPFLEEHFGTQKIEL